MRILYIAILTGLTITSLAQESNHVEIIEQRLDSCANGFIPPRSVDTRACYSKAIVELEDYVEILYLRLDTILNSVGKEILYKSHKSWLNFYEMEIELIYHSSSERIGTLYLDVQKATHYDLIKYHAKRLEDELWLYNQTIEDKVEKQ